MASCFMLDYRSAMTYDVRATTTNTRCCDGSSCLMAIKGHHHSLNGCQCPVAICAVQWLYYNLIDFECSLHGSIQSATAATALSEDAVCSRQLVTTIHRYHLSLSLTFYNCNCWPTATHLIAKSIKLLLQSGALTLTVAARFVTASC